MMSQTYKCIPASVIAREDIDSGGKISLPESALSQLIQLNVATPYMFKIENIKTKKFSHCGVLDFNSTEGTCILPTWLMNTLELTIRDPVRIVSRTLSPGKFIKFQPLTSDFTSKVTNPKVVLERKLRNFACLTQGDVIEIKYLKMVFYISVLETKPSQAIDIIRTDCNVEFAPPRDQKQLTKEQIEKEIKKMQKESQKKVELSESTSEDDISTSEEEKNKEKFKPFEGSGIRIDGKKTPIKKGINNSESSNSKKKTEEETKPKLNIFEGSGQRIDGKTIKKKSKDNKVNKPAEEETFKTPTKNKPRNFKPFSGGGNRIDNKRVKKRELLSESETSESEEENNKKKSFGRSIKIEEKKEEKKFVPFSSTGNTLSSKK
ncbi:ubiquitin recognition factor in er-associated degradation protein [Anaeramoeba flamelloides]|uniref:Ubiquitin recognition factor in er-associated degradation protein n=1 Tax=Anaeramoeba flamelloides TaxID=1746091 RepID=A0AAV7YBM2_9EUKA|nr:ubiquitin recognition factor in er-associated degradation protein [Anaeramoeba flamelloides]